MQAEIITIGDEILIGQTVDTNSAWMGQLLSSNGIRIHRSTSIADTKEEILSAIDEALSRSELVLVTGGLGPTKDDITKHTLCTYFGTTLEIDTEVLSRIETFFAKRNKPMLESNVQQAAMPKSCEVLANDVGTASGMWFEKNGNILVSMPGVPYEMKFLMQERVLPKVKQRFKLSEMYHQTLMTSGIGESFLAQKIEDWENEVRAEGFGLAYLPSLGGVKLRLTSVNGEKDKSKIDAYFKRLEKALPYYVYGRNEIKLQEKIGDILKARKQTLSAVESCTGGALSARIVSVSGSSSYYMGSFVSYTNRLKKELVNVRAETLSEFGAVSEETVIEMAVGGREKLETDYCISISGVAGPDGGTDLKPVGTVWLAIAHENGVETKKLNLGNSRINNIELTINYSLHFFKNLLENNLELAE
ncbi:MAG: competence/damage-inducible protein A [Lishizhenia sp.]